MTSSPTASRAVSCEINRYRNGSATEASRLAIKIKQLLDRLGEFGFAELCPQVGQVRRAALALHEHREDHAVAQAYAPPISSHDCQRPLPVPRPSLSRPGCGEGARPKSSPTQHPVVLGTTGTTPNQASGQSVSLTAAKTISLKANTTAPSSACMIEHEVHSAEGVLTILSARDRVARAEQLALLS